MKQLKMLGLAALAALMAMAVIGASSASAEATSLCSNDSSTECTEITHVHEESVGHALLLSSFATVQCEVLFLGDSSSGAPLIVEGTFTYTCLNGCTATEENGPAEIKVLKTATELSSVTGEGLVHVVCGLNCRYNGVGLEGHGLGALSAANGVGEVTLEGVTVNKESGTFCPSTSKLDITTEPLTATYIGTGLHYCVEYEHNTNGFYKDNKCTEGPVAGRAFDLAIGAKGLTAGTAVCVRVPAGLWKDRACTVDAKTLTEGRYEKGTIRTVQ